MKKIFLKPIKFIKKFEDRVIDITLNVGLDTKSPYEVALSCDNNYTVIYYKDLPNINCYKTLCFFKENNKIVCCYVNMSTRLRINRDIVGNIDYNILIENGVPLL